MLKNFLHTGAIKFYGFYEVAPGNFQIWKMAERNFEFDTTDLPELFGRIYMVC